MWGVNGATGEHTVLKCGTPERLIDAVVQEAEAGTEALRMLLVTYHYWTTQAKLWDLLTQAYAFRFVTIIPE